MNNVSIRTATLQDSKLLLRWVNAADSLNWKKITKTAISSGAHHKWLISRLNKPDTGIWIILSNGLPAGQIRLEPQGEEVNTDIYIEANKRGKGIASVALQQALQHYCRKFGPKKFKAIVHRQNKASKILFLKNNFNIVVDSDTDWLELVNSFDGKY